MFARLLGPSTLIVALIIGLGFDSLRSDDPTQDTVVTAAPAEARDVVNGDDVEEATTTTPSTMPPTTTAPPTTTTTITPREEATLRAEEIVAALSPEEQVAQLFVVEVAPESAAQAIRTEGWGGVFLKMETYTAETTIDTISGAQAAAYEIGQLGLFISSDVEGGRISKMPVAPLPAPADLRSLSSEQLQATYRSVATELCSLGVNLNLAPVGDVNEFDNPVLADGRAFSNDPGEVAAYVSQVINAYRSATPGTTGGVATTTKHFPGHGAASLDTHKSGAVIASREAITPEHLPPFEAAIERYREVPGAIMIGHLTLEGETEPATFSGQVVTEWLRNDLGHDGVVITDDLANMAAVTDRPVAERARLALLAGIDLLLWNDIDKARDARAAIESEVLSLPDGDVASRVRESAIRAVVLKIELGLTEPERGC